MLRDIPKYSWHTFTHTRKKERGILKNEDKPNIFIGTVDENFNMDCELDNVPMLNILILVIMQQICKIMFLFLRHINWRI